MSGHAAGGANGGTAGFILAGGQSTRMGRDKALLPLDGANILTKTAEKVREAAGSATIVGEPGRYAQLGFDAISDEFEPCGPLGGLYTALRSSAAREWNLVTACDMPGLTVTFLASLVLEAGESSVDCLVPLDPDGNLHPLCAVYRRGCLPIVESMISHKQFKMHDLIGRLQAKQQIVSDKLLLQNLNTPHDWEFYTHLETR